jgi:hypothetical protein
MQFGKPGFFGLGQQFFSLCLEFSVARQSG